jgi:hypothetical protein
MYSNAIKDQMNVSKKALLNHFKLEDLIKPLMGQEHSRLELHAAFDLIKDKTNFKNPINSQVLKKDYEISNEACIFFTGSSLDIIGENDTHYQVEAVGYYAAIGA